MNYRNLRESFDSYYCDDDPADNLSYDECENLGYEYRVLPHFVEV